MTQRQKLDLPLNEETTITLLYSEPVSGRSKYGNYNMYAVAVGDEEYSFFPTEEVFEQIRNLKKGDSFSLTKIASRQGNKLITSYDVRLHGKEMKQSVTHTEENIPAAAHDTFFSLMLQSYRDALEISGELNGMADPEKIAVTLFIARSKQSNY